MAECTTAPLGLSAAPAQTFPQVLGAAVSQDGDEGLLIRAELLLSGLEEDLHEQINNTFEKKNIKRSFNKTQQKAPKQTECWTMFGTSKEGKQLGC